jgi:hypothetical protein
MEYTQKWNFIFSQEENMAFLPHIVTKLTNAQQQFVQISRTDSPSNRILAVDSLDGKLMHV